MTFLVQCISIAPFQINCQTRIDMTFTDYFSNTKDQAILSFAFQQNTRNNDFDFTKYCSVGNI